MHISTALRRPLQGILLLTFLSQATLCKTGLDTAHLGYQREALMSRKKLQPSLDEGWISISSSICSPELSGQVKNLADKRPNTPRGHLAYAHNTAATASLTTRSREHASCKHAFSPTSTRKIRLAKVNDKHTRTIPKVKKPKFVLCLASDGHGDMYVQEESRDHHRGAALELVVNEIHEATIMKYHKVLLCVCMRACTGSYVHESALIRSVFVYVMCVCLSASSPGLRSSLYALFDVQRLQSVADTESQ
jgi:hypothetical protein